MGIEDAEAAAEQDRHADDVDPVHHAHRQAMAVDALHGGDRRRRAVAIASASMSIGSP
jgi:hypothetical protein